MYNYLVYLRFLSPFSLLSEQLCQLSVYLHYSLCRHRKSDDEEMSGGARCCFGFLTFLAQILLHGVVGLVLFWVIAYHSKDNVGPFSFRTDPELEWNLHPVLMILGFIYFMGQGENFSLLQSKPADNSKSNINLETCIFHVKNFENTFNAKSQTSKKMRCLLSRPLLNIFINILVVSTQSLQKGFEKSKGQNLGHHKILESPLFF